MKYRRMWHDAGLTHAFFRLEPADGLMATYRPTWRDHLVLPDDAPYSDGWGACLQYLRAESADAFRHDPDLPLSMVSRRLVATSTEE